MPDSRGKAVFRGMSRAALDAAYNNGAAVPGSADIVAGWRERSAALRATDSTARLDIPYGERPREKLDFFPAAARGAPLFVFIHGGYWQRNDRDTFSLFAQGPRANGFAVAVPGYTLTPEVRLGTIVEEMRRALTFLAGHAGELGFDAAQIHVGGWSAGGHLTAMMLDHPAVKGGLSISGIFDLEPIALCYLNDAVRLDAAEIAELSPLRRIAPGLAPARICVGADELPELRRQSEEYSAAATAAGLAAPLRILDGRHHYSIMDELADPSGALCAELVSLRNGT